MENNTQKPEEETGASSTFDLNFDLEDQKKLDKSGARYSYELNTGPGLVDGSNFHGKKQNKFDSIVPPPETDKKTNQDSNPYLPLRKSNQPHTSDPL